MKTFKAPTNWTPVYDQAARDDVIAIIDFLNRSAISKTRLAQKASMSATTLSLLLNGKYTSPPRVPLDKVLEAIDIEQTREARQVDLDRLVETEVYKLIVSTAHRARVTRMLACVTATPGTGKTVAIQRYASQHDDVFIVDTMPNMNASAMLMELIEQINARAIVDRARASRQGTADQMARAVVKKLRGTNSLLIVDEAESAAPRAIEYIRKISNQARIGALFVGDEVLFANLHNSTNQLDKTRSRFCLFPDPIRHLSRSDSDALCRAYLAEHEKDLTDKVLDAFWECSAGSARVLCDTLISAVKDFGLNQGFSLKPALVYQVSQQVLNYSDRISIERAAKVKTVKAQTA